MRRLLIAAVMAGALAAGLSACGPRTTPEPDPTPDPASRRTLSGGQVTGLLNVAGAHEWRAIPFAAPPVGALRWRAPRPAAPWSGVLEAHDQPVWCAQVTNRLDAAYDIEPGSIAGSEDCLYLNVAAPAVAPDAVPSGEAAWPVMVWIHGGGNVWGRAEQYHPATLAARQGVVVVTIQYRLGSLGWFAHPALRDTAETPDDASANFATLDMIAALEWVRDNAAAFGGDPGRVTIFGESAGGHNVASLIASPRAKGLFHRAIIQSGSFFSVTLEEAEAGTDNQPFGSERVIADVLRGRGRAPDLSLASGPQEVVDTLQGFSVEEVLGVFQRDDPDAFVDPPRVIADGVVLPQSGLREVLSDPAAFNSVPIITGANRDETKLFNLLDDRYTTARLGLLYTAKDPDLYDSIAAHQSRMWAIDAVDQPSNAMTAGGHADVWAYRFDWDEQGRVLWSDFSRLLGAAHSLEIPFVFGKFRFLGRGDVVVFTDDNASGRIALSDTMMQAWGDFARTGDPGGDWTRWTAGGARVVFDTDADGGVRMETGVDDREAVLESLASGDTRLTTEAERCAAFNAVVEWRPDLEEARSGFLGGACSKGE